MVLYVETTPGFKKRLAALAKKHFRSLTGEAHVAIEEYLAKEEAKEGIGDAAKPKEKGKGK